MLATVGYLHNMSVVVNRFALKALREKDGQSVAGLARLAGISRVYLHRIEAGTRNASPAIRKDLAAGLKVPTSAIETVKADEDRIAA